MNIENLGLGRKEPKEDERDKKFLISDIIPKKIDRTHRYWYAQGWWGDQGSKPHCVGYAFAHYIEDGPITHGGKAPIIDPSGLYKMAQKIDEWPGENYDGTSVRAGAKVLQTLGLISEYRWGWNLQSLIDAVLLYGPVVVGTYWYYDMFFPKGDNGLITATGEDYGGHAYLINGVNTKTKLFRLKNSWGRSWGNDGYASISFEDMEKLIHENGEVCLAREVKTK